MMASFWPTEAAIKNMAVVAKKMNEAQKIVFSRTMSKADWQNTRVVKNNLAEDVKKMKNETGADMVIFGSGTIVAQLTDARLIDEYQLVIHPLVLGGGRTMFDGIKNRLDLKRTTTRNFSNGNVLLSYGEA
jgi:dihydrofolate reductase